jgi:YfiH family protein
VRKSQPVSEGSVSILRVNSFPTWAVHGFSTRVGGVSKVYGGSEHVRQNRELFLRELGRESWPIITLRQVHSDVVHTIDAIPREELTGDGIVTATPGILLAVQSADCLPILLVDTRRRVVGAFHAGWRGTLARISEKGVGVLRRDCGTDPADVHAAIGPGIGACCYEVGEELRDKFHGQFAYAADLFHEVEHHDQVREKYPLLFMNARAPGHGDMGRKLHLDLAGANRRQLLSAGVKEGNISVIAMCTACRPDLFFSYRAAKGPTGRQLGVVAISPGSPSAPGSP